MSVELPAVPRVQTVEQLTTHLNDRLRRISLELGPGARGEPGPAGPPGTPGGGGGGEDLTYIVPIFNNIATPNASYAVNILIESTDTFVAPPIGVPAAGAGLAAWRLEISLAVAGCSTQFDPSYAFEVSATGPDSPITATVSMNLSTDSTGATTLVSVSATT